MVAGLPDLTSSEQPTLAPCLDHGEMVPNEAIASHDPAPAEFSRLVVGEPPGESEEL